MNQNELIAKAGVFDLICDHVLALASAKQMIANQYQQIEDKDKRIAELEKQHPPEHTSNP